MLTYFPLLVMVAQALQAQPDPGLRSGNGAKSMSIMYAEQAQAAYRDCLAENAADLSLTAGVDDSYLATVADLACDQQRNNFITSMHGELRHGSTRLSDEDEAQMVQVAHNEIVAWAEGIIFASRRLRSTT